MTRTFHHFSPELKQRIVAELEEGQLTLREAAQDARTTINQVRVWLDEYGRYKPKRDIVEVVMRGEQERITALEKAVAEAHLKLAVYEELITQANTRFKTDIKKLWYATAHTLCHGDRRLDLSAVCRVLGCTRDAYYKRQRRTGPARDTAADVMGHVDALRAVQPRLGTRKLHDALTTAGVQIGRDALFTALRTSGRLVARKRRATQTTYSHHGYAVAPNLVKDLTVTGPRHVVVCDITYLRLERGAFAYLFLVTDLFARYIVGWHLSRDLSHHAALRALDHAQDALGDGTGIVHHSDRGSQYCCHDYLRQLYALRALPSMTDAAHCYQNAVAERVNGILKDEFDLDAVFPTLAAAQHAVAHAVTIYNTVRPHWSLDLQTPQAVFQQATQPALIV